MANNNATRVKAYLYEDSHTGTSVKVREVRLLMITDITYAILRQKIKSVFPDLNNQSFAVTWQDEEGDNITVSSEEELLQAITFASGGMLRVYIRITGVEKSASPDVEVSAANESAPAKETSPLLKPEIHPNVLCDGCNGAISGARYKCLTCEDYDLCETCLMKNTHNEHDMIRIVAPTRGCGTRAWFKPMQHIWFKMARHSAHLDKKQERLKEKIDSVREKHCKRMYRMRSKREDHKSSDKADATSSGTSGYFQENPFLYDCGFGPFFGLNGNLDKNAILKNIGTSVANMLDPLGINVTVDVENSDGEIEPCASCPTKSDQETSSGNQFCQSGGLFGSANDEKDSEKSSPKSDDPPSLGRIISNISEMSGNLFQHMQNLSPEERKEFAKERFIEVQGILSEVLHGVTGHLSEQTTKAPATSSAETTTANSSGVVPADSNEVTSSASAENSVPVEAASDVAKAEVKQVQEQEQTKPKQTGAISKIKIDGIAGPPTSTLIDVSDDTMETSGCGWTIVNSEATQVKSRSISPQSQAAQFVPLTKLTEASAVTPSLYPSVELEDAKYQLALEQMLHMGYTNEGEWLVPLIKAKQGNIAAIMDVLHPNK